MRITAGSLTGNGTIRANGGSDTDTLGGGGGGRIAVVYDPVAQAGVPTGFRVYSGKGMSAGS